MEFLIASFDWLKEHQVFEIASVLLFFKLLPWINYCFMEMKLPKFCLNISIISKLELRITQPSKKHKFFSFFQNCFKNYFCHDFFWTLILKIFCHRCHCMIFQFSAINLNSKLIFFKLIKRIYLFWSPIPLLDPKIKLILIFWKIKNPFIFLFKSKINLILIIGKPKIPLFYFFKSKIKFSKRSKELVSEYTL